MSAGAVTIPATMGNAVKHFRSCIRQNAGLWTFPIRVLANAATSDIAMSGSLDPSHPSEYYH